MRRLKAAGAGPPPGPPVRGIRVGGLALGEPPPRPPGPAVGPLPVLGRVARWRWRQAAATPSPAAPSLTRTESPKSPNCARQRTAPAGAERDSDSPAPPAARQSGTARAAIRRHRRRPYRRSSGQSRAVMLWGVWAQAAAIAGRMCRAVRAWSGFKVRRGRAVQDSELLSMLLSLSLADLHPLSSISLSLPVAAVQPCLAFKIPVSRLKAAPALIRHPSAEAAVLV